MILGQWIGDFEGAHNGRCTVNIELSDGMLNCYAYLIDSNGESPSSYASFTLERGKERYTVEINNICAIDKNFHVLHPSLTEAFVRSNYPNSEFAKTATLDVELIGTSLKLDAFTNIGTEFHATLYKNFFFGYKLEAEECTWSQFKSKIEDMNYREVAFRGQEKGWPLMTSFHRYNRYDVQAYARSDIAMLHRRLSGMTKHYFNLNDQQHIGAFLNLLQHHGYPTPLLDWSYSPYVASYFAFNPVIESSKGNSITESKVRIFVFEIKKWKKNIPQFDNLFDSRPHLSVGEYLTLDNPRALPQQALTTITNIYDIEGYLYHCGGNSDKYLRAYDISCNEAHKVMKDLHMMGITFGTLFPGFDGACHDLKKINFNIS
ncbi:FRG domain-containing protein [Pantoea ananatis]|uniref:FRG domain-containing protein n=1 Tax=Pantoea ananas TaxID=553 RepID=UPI003FA42D28